MVESGPRAGRPSLIVFVWSSRCRVSVESSAGSLGGCVEEGKKFLGIGGVLGDCSLASDLDGRLCGGGMEEGNVGVSGLSVFVGICWIFLFDLTAFQGYLSEFL